MFQVIYMRQSTENISTCSTYTRSVSIAQSVVIPTLDREVWGSILEQNNDFFSCFFFLQYFLTQTTVFVFLYFFQNIYLYIWRKLKNKREKFFFNYLYAINLELAYRWPKNINGTRALLPLCSILGISLGWHGCPYMTACLDFKQKFHCVSNSVSPK